MKNILIASLLLVSIFFCAQPVRAVDDNYCRLIKSVGNKETWNCDLPVGWKVTCTTYGNQESLKYLPKPIRKLSLWMKVGMKYRYLVRTGQVPPEYAAGRDCWAVNKSI
jgi:uncharacterized protein YbdZ (MbtH family)